MSRHTHTRRGAEPTLQLLARLAARLPDRAPAPRECRAGRPWKGTFESNGKFVAFPVFRGDLPCQRGAAALNDSAAGNDTASNNTASNDTAGNDEE